MAEKKNTAQENLRFYEQLRKVPQEALKKIQGGRLNGMSDINPLFRVKAMTEAFGPCGIGWKYEITKQWQETYGQEVKSFTNINLYVKVDGEWSEPIPGTGGATIVEVNSKGYAYVNDEGHKMSLTDALSVAMKALGVAADVYYSKDPNKSVFESKYEQSASVQQNTQQAQQPAAQPQAQQPAAVDASVYTAEISQCADMNALMVIWNKYPSLQNDKAFRDTWAARRRQVDVK